MELNYQMAKKGDAMNWSRSAIFLIISLTINVSHINGFNSLLRDYHQFEQLLIQNNSTIELEIKNQFEDISSGSDTKRTPIKPWTFIVYMSADNDLRAFAANNIKQMASLGSNHNVNIVVHLDIRINGNQKITRYYYIEKNKLVHLNSLPNNQSMDSGNPQTLIACCDWAIKSFPANNYALILWNHGTGVLEPKPYKTINPAELFFFNPHTNKLELDRSICFLDFIYFTDLDKRGVCWDNSTGNFLTNQQLDEALNKICKDILGKKFSLIGFDACLMSMIEVAHYIKKYADVMVGSQEVELGTGWQYAHVLQSLHNGSVDPVSFASHIVGAYKNFYSPITNDFTQSAIDLKRVHLIEQNINTVSTLLLECIRHQQKNSVSLIIKSSKNRQNCTHFDIPCYIDLHHFYCNLLDRLPSFHIQPSHHHLTQQLSEQLQQGKQLISTVIFANTAGQSLKKARGISIYFPEQYIDLSYQNSMFAKSNKWYQLIATCKAK